MNVIRASGALKKFLDARERGASREVLRQLYAACEAEKPAKVAARPTPRRFERQESARNNYQSEKNREQRSRDVVVYLERARLEREWESAPD